jgi:hypothetical protein
MAAAVEVDGHDGGALRDGKGISLLDLRHDAGGSHGAVEVAAEEELGRAIGRPRTSSPPVEIV